MDRKYAEAKEVIEHGEVVTAIYVFGIGLAYLYDGDVWETAGSRAVQADREKFSLYGILRDNGKFYREAISTVNFKVSQDVYDDALLQLSWFEGEADLLA